MDSTTVFRDALRYVVNTSVEKVAKDTGYSRSLLDGYLNRRPPSKAAVLALANLLRVRAAELERHAMCLDEVADEDRRGDSA
jgi:transcriptional regulator with XRE-family HTH domain